MASTKTSRRTSPYAQPISPASGDGSQPTIKDAETRKRASAAEPSSLTALIERTLAASSAPDPHAVALGLLPQLSAEDRDALVIMGLVQRVYALLRIQRSANADLTPRGGPSKWQIATRVCVSSGRWKFLSECDVADLTALAEQHRDIAAKNLARAAEYDRLRDELEASGCATVGEMWEHKSKGLAA